MSSCSTAPTSGSVACSAATVHAVALARTASSKQSETLSCPRSRVLALIHGERVTRADLSKSTGRSEVFLGSEPERSDGRVPIETLPRQARQILAPRLELF